MIKNIIDYMVLINIPAYFLLFLLYSFIFNFKYKMPIKKLILFSICLSILDSISKHTIYPQWQTPLGIVFFTILIKLFFDISTITSFLSSIAISVIFLIIQLPIFVIFNLYTIGSELIQNNIKYGLMFTLSYIPIIVLLIVIAHKKTNFHINWFVNLEFDIKTKFNKSANETIKYATPILLAFIGSLAISFAALIFDINNKNFYFILITIISFGFSYAYYWVWKQLKEYKLYEVLYKQSEVYKKTHPEEF